MDVFLCERMLQGTNIGPMKVTPIAIPIGHQYRSYEGSAYCESHRYCFLLMSGSVRYWPDFETPELPKKNMSRPGLQW